MNIHQLAVFHAVAEQSSLTKAAALLFISQPAVSKQLRELERSLGMALFHRLSTGVRLTEAGELLLGYSRQIFALEHEAESALRELHNLERGRLRIGASTTVGTYVLPPACARFGRSYPKVELALDIDNSRAIVERLRAGRVDMALVEGPIQDDEFARDEIGRDALVPIASPFHPLCCLKEIPFEKLAEHPILLREDGSGTRAVLQAAYEERDLTPQVKMTLGNTEAIKRAVAAGVALAWVSRLSIESEVQSGTLKVLGGPSVAIERPLFRLRVPGRYESRAVREFLRMLRKLLHGESSGETAPEANEKSAA
jgi:DNA-binding transcriptional LysR family regulator